VLVFFLGGFFSWMGLLPAITLTRPGQRLFLPFCLGRCLGHSAPVRGSFFSQKGAYEALEGDLLPQAPHSFYSHISSTIFQNVFQAQLTGGIIVGQNLQTGKSPGFSVSRQHFNHRDISRKNTGTTSPLKNDSRRRGYRSDPATAKTRHGTPLLPISFPSGS